VPLAHDRTGSGPPLVLLHGLGSCKEMWRPVVPLLAGERDVITVDLPGFGASPPGATTVEQMAREVAEFADGLGLDRWHVAGNSMGGGIALELAARGRVRSACGVSPLGFANDREAVYARGVLVATRGISRALVPVAPALARNPALRTLLTSHIVARPWRVPPGDAALWTRMCAEAPSFWALLRSAPDWHVDPPACPTTVAWGERDRLLIFSRQAPRARRMVPAARHVTLTGCGHLPTWDDPEQVARVLLEASLA
jgi:pimeloyl-ACP methyl ester carboxylesterase